jgi:pimeloyl-ACP methyl ester carboxylesterase
VTSNVAPIAQAAPPPRVLVIPGLDGNTALWRRAAPTVFPDLRPVWFDHARDRAEGGFEGLAERALRVLDLDAETDNPAYICGESFGGPVALTLARRYPHRVRGLLLVSTFGQYPSQLVGRVALAAWHVLGDRLSEHVLRASHPLTLPGALGLRCPPDLATAYLRRPLVDIRAYREKCELAVNFDARHWLGAIRSRAFVLVGTWDPVVSVSSAKALVRHLPNASLHSVRGGHLAWSVRSAEVGALVRPWLDANECH